MTSKLLPILFAVTMAGMLSFPGHAASAEEFVGAVTVGPGDGIIESITVSPVQAGDTTVSVEVALSPGWIDDSLNPDDGVQVSVGTDDAEFSAVAILTYGADSILGTDTLSGTVDLSTVGILVEDGTVLHVGVDTWVDGEINFQLGTAFISVTAFSLVCGYDTFDDIDYGSLTRGGSATEMFTPSISDDTRFIQPTVVDFDISPFVNGDGENVVLPTHTSVNGIAGPAVQIDNVDADSAFEFKTQMNFINSNAFLSSIGQTITQTTTITPACSTPEPVAPTPEPVGTTNSTGGTEQQP